MSEFTVALGLAAPVYNLAFVIIALYLFVKLFKMPTSKPKSMIPWKVLFAAVSIFILEEAITVLRRAELVNIPVHINGFFELAIITLFIYTLLKQKQISKF